jgi:hypothetical protein
VLELPASQNHQLRLLGVTDALKPQLDDLKALLAGKPLLPCADSNR